MNSSPRYIHGFTCVWEKELPELASTVFLYEHVKTGAQLLFVKNDETEKFYTITFRTPPEDDTGCTHIIEHSVLVGSESFPSKQPFMELYKGSLKTFANAMTFPDMTSYPFASKNPTDFLNLLTVYTDAVFFPKMYDKEEIFQQEGWHYDLTGRDEEMIYKGVVYNEMKGAFSDPNRILHTAVSRILYPDTPGSYESGGIPEKIPTLTRERFLDYHRRHYHPSNAYIFLSGDVDLPAVLELLETKYLSRFERITPDVHYPLQRPFDKPVDQTVFYPSRNNSPQPDPIYHTLSFVTGDVRAPLQTIAMDILCDILFKSEASPVRRLLLEKGLGQAVVSMFNDMTRQPYLSLWLIHAGDTTPQLFRETVLQEIERLASGGLDPQLVKATINRHEFDQRELDTSGFPRGLSVAINVLKSWIHGGYPLAYLTLDDNFDKIRQGASEGMFEKLIRTELLDNNHAGLITMKPDPTLAGIREQQERKELDDFRNSLSKEQLDAIIEQTRDLQEIQKAPDRPEDLQKLPVLKRSDLNPDITPLPLEEGLLSGVDTCRHPMPTNGILYLNQYFDLSSVTVEDRPWLRILAMSLGKLPTRKHTFQELANLINIHTGGLQHSLNIMTPVDDLENPQFHFKVSGRCLYKSVPDMIDLTAEILLHTSFRDRDRMREIISELATQYRMMVQRSALQLAFLRLGSYYTVEVYLREQTDGLTFLHMIEDLQQNFDQRYETMIEKLEKLAGMIFNRKALTLSIGSDPERVDTIEKAIDPYLEQLPALDLCPLKIPFEPHIRNEGLAAPSQVQYCTMGYNLHRLGYRYQGSMLVLRNAVTMDFLLPKIRVQGGAYGAGLTIDRLGDVAMYSYRDPNLVDTLEAFRGVAGFVENFESSPREFLKLVIGTISDLDPVLTPPQKTQAAMGNRFRNISDEMRSRIRREVLECTPQQIRDHAAMLRDVIGKDSYCVFGSDEKLNQNKELFGTIVPVIR